MSTVQIQAPTNPIHMISRRFLMLSRHLEPSEKHTLHGFLRTQLDKLRPAKRDPADVCENIVRDYEADGQEEPDHAFEDVVHDEVSLHHNEIERHVCPCELGELEAVVAFLE